MALAGLLLAAGCRQSGPTPPALFTQAAAATVTAGPAGTASALPPTVAPSPTPVPAAAWVNGQPIPAADAAAEARRCELAQAFPDCSARALESLIEQAVVEQAAQAAGLSVSDADLAAALARLQQERGGPAGFQAWLAATGYGEAEFLAALRSELLRARMAEHVTASIGEAAEQAHALVIVAADEATAANLLAQLQSGADFATLAVDYSLDLSSRAAGGDLGWFPRGWLTVPEVEQAAFSLAPGETSVVLPGALGYSIVRVLERDPARPLTPAMRQALRTQAYAAWLAEAKAAAVIERPAAP
ncbi:MAG: peptidylprolyl isomerase [Anaerolineales bacterium]|nr:peptidylprolyl isomerase [Anaerolineales bacterium]